LALALASRHLLEDELGYWIFSWVGVVVIIVGLWRVFVRDED
jgi:hypothetical protein